MVDGTSLLCYHPLTQLIVFKGVAVGPYYTPSIPNECHNGLAVPLTYPPLILVMVHAPHPPVPSWLPAIKSVLYAGIPEPFLFQRSYYLAVDQCCIPA